MELNEAQRQYLLSPIHRSRIGRDGKGHSHVEAWDIRRVLNGTFGFTGWSGDTLTMELIYEDTTGGKFAVAYRAQYRIIVGDSTYTEWAVGDCKNYPSRGDAHDMAIKTAESQAFKRAAMNLGDQFGLSLYDGGSLKQSIKATLDVPVGKADSADKAKEFADALEIEGGGIPETPAATPASDPAPSPTRAAEDATEAPAPDLSEYVDKFRALAVEGDVAGIVTLKALISTQGLSESVVEGKTLAKYADLAVVHAGKVTAAATLGGEEVSA